MYRPADFREDRRAMLHPLRTLGDLPKRDSGRPDLAQTWLLFLQYWRFLRLTQRQWGLAIGVNLILYIVAIAGLDLGPSAGGRPQGLVCLGIGVAISYVLASLVMVRARRLVDGEYDGRFYASPPDGGPPAPVGG
jgi:hypothetical protein